MTEGRLRVAIGAVSLVGAAIAAYLLYVRYSGARLACATGGCETVQQSSYSKLLGVPVAALGLAGYLAVLATALRGDELARAVGVSVALAGVGFSAYLLYVQLALIDAVCDWCVASDVVMSVLAVLTLLRVSVVSRSDDGLFPDGRRLGAREHP